MKCTTNMIVTRCINCKHWENKVREQARKDIEKESFEKIDGSILVPMKVVNKVLG